MFWGTPILLFGVVKLLTFTSGARRRVLGILVWLASRWVDGDFLIFDTLLPTKWHVEGPGALRYDAQYLVMSNHVSWVDIFAVLRAFHGKSAFLRFFLKSILIWTPIVGQACWALEFPFMKRYSPEYLAKHPEKRGRDLETTRRAMRRYRTLPVTILNYIEGTRFTEAKRVEQESPYRHLLRPRPGGIAFVLASLGDQLDAVFDVTIAYPRAEVTFWQFINGRLDRVDIHVREIAVPPEFFDVAITEPGPERDRFKAWIESVWREKDELLDRLTKSESPAA